MAGYPNPLFLACEKSLPIFSRSAKAYNSERHYFDILSRRHEQRTRDVPWVFWHRYKNHTSGIWGDRNYAHRKNLMRGLYSKAGARPFGFHALRHAGASVMDTNNVPIGSIQKILGHENRTTTEIYLHGIGDFERHAMDVYELYDLAADRLQEESERRRGTENRAKNKQRYV